MCQCHEAVVPPVVPEVSDAPQPESKPENTSEEKLKRGTKRKRNSKDTSEPPVKKILGDGTRLPGTPVTWKSCSTGIVIKLVKCLKFCLENEVCTTYFSHVQR